MSKHLIRAMVLSVSFLAAAGCTSGNANPTAGRATPTTTPTPSTMNVAGTFELAEPGGEIPGEECQGQGGYSDLAEGASVTIYDSKGEAVGLGALGPGVGTEGYGSVCHFSFLVVNVPSKGTIFSVEVANRGQVKFSKADAQHVAVTINGQF